MATATAPEPGALPEGPVLLYDGVCGLCAKSVRWILHHERDHDLRFAPLQGETAAALRAKYPRIPEQLSTVVYIDADRVHLRSKAFLYLSRHLRGPWRWLYAMRWWPAVLGDLGYRLVAATRYRLFGKHDSCEITSPEHRARFLP
jgi:predicted DCC family thiol-disulfide oxidoreductase YuxK